MLPPAVTLMWLGLRLRAQDRMIEAQRAMERRQVATESVVRSLTQSITELENNPAAAQMPEGVVRLSVGADVIAQPEAVLLWRQRPPAIPEAAAQPFEAAERAEFQGDPNAALAAYRESEHSTNVSVRAGALLRIARVERNRGRIDSALNAYRALALIADIASNGAPIDFVARRAICDVLRATRRTTELHREADALEAEFLANHWLIDRPLWDLAAGEIQQWTGRTLAIRANRKTLSLAADWAFENLRNATSSGSGHVVLDGEPVTVVWRTGASKMQNASMEVLIVTQQLVQTWLQKAIRNSSFKADQITLVTESEESRSRTASTPSTLKLPSASTGLPWTLVVAEDASTNEADSNGRGRLMAWGLASIILLLAGGSYFLWRVVERELAVARLQTDFVAAVSHEFRTPLTSLRHITELLEEDDGSPGAEHDRRKTFYAALGRNTERLHRLVESLLDFSRMETGRKPWHLRSMDAGELTAEVASEFRKEVETQGVQVDLDVDTSRALRLRADSDALAHALWNLLDNAVKYSPLRTAVRVSVRRNECGIVIAVKDEGLGIPEREQRQIFRKFVRGDKASELGIKGTGLGLAMVSHIVAAHGGAVELESEEGKGSTFRLVLPAEA
jgi:signal transduction histidine kinase